MTYQTSLGLSNSSKKQMTLHIEPWGEQISMPPYSTFQIVAEAEEQGSIEVEYDDDDIKVWAWSGSTFRVFSNGHEIGARRQIVPPVPDGMRVSSFIRFIEGKTSNK